MLHFTRLTYFAEILACPEGAFAGEVNGASFDSWRVTTVTVLVGLSTGSGIALIDDEEKTGCSLSYAKGSDMPGYRTTRFCVTGSRSCYAHKGNT